jgi:hypothetical protein
MSRSEAERIVVPFRAYLKDQNLEFKEQEIDHGVKFEVYKGALCATLPIYKSGASRQGKASEFRDQLLGVIQAITKGEAPPSNGLPVDITTLPDRILERIPDSDPIVLAYLREAIVCFRNQALLGTALLLGGASERAIRLMVETFANALASEKQRANLQNKLKGSNISAVWDEFNKVYKPCKTKPTGPEFYEIDKHLDLMFNICRLTRNEVGHPKVTPQLEKGFVLSQLGYFAQYIDRIYLMSKFFRDNRVEN